MKTVFVEKSDGSYDIRVEGKLAFFMSRDPEVKKWVVVDLEGNRVLPPEGFRHDLIERLEEWLASQGLESVSRYTGYIADEDLPLKIGDEITLPAGITVYWPTATASMDKVTVTKRKQTVRINHIMNGSTEVSIRSKGRHLSNPKIAWAGRGGYWCEVLFSDLESAGLLPESK